MIALVFSHYLSVSPFATREAILKDLDQQLTSGIDASNDTFMIMAASVYLHEEVHFRGIF